MAKLTVLGSGTSTGVPTIGCSCEVCQSTNGKDKRLRTSALYENNGVRILLDCGPDFRAQILPLDFAPLDGVLITHEHYDHVGGLDDLRSFTYYGELPIYAETYTAKRLKQRMPYCFVDKSYPGIPQLKLKELKPFESFAIKGVQVLPLRINHGQLPILGYRIGNMAYITDMSSAPTETVEAIKGVEVLLINALRSKPHLTHQTINEAVHFAQTVEAKQTFFIHMSHDIGLHDEAESKLPENIFYAYDGLEITL